MGRLIFALALILPLCFAVASEAANEVVGKDVYIAIRKNGVAGSGSMVDPFDGSTQAKFDAVFAACDPGRQPNVTFHLAPGTYQTLGNSSRHVFTLRTGWKIMGSGIDSTIIQLKADAAVNHSKIGVISSAGDFQAVEDLTIDGNIANQPQAPNDICVSGVSINGAIRRVKVINCGTTLERTELESFWIMTGGKNSDVNYNQVIEDCICIAPATPMYVTFITASGGNTSPDGPVSIAARNVIIRGNKVVCPTSTGRFIGHAFTCANADSGIVEDNYTDGISEGYYQDTWSNRKLVIRHNSFCRVGHGVFLDNPPPYYNQDVIVDDNYIDLLPITTGTDSWGVATHGVFHDGLYIRRNKIRLTPDTTSTGAVNFGIIFSTHVGTYFNCNAQVRDNCIDLPMVAHRLPSGTTAEWRATLEESGVDYENNYDTPGDFIIGRHHSRFSFDASSVGWYTAFAKETVENSSGILSVFTMPEETGTATLSDGAVTIPCASVKRDSRIVLKMTSPGGTPGALIASAVIPGSSFKVTSTSKSDGSTFAWSVTNGGTLAGQVAFNQPSSGHGGTITQIVADTWSALTTADQIRAYSDPASLSKEVDVHVTAPARVTLDISSDDNACGYYENLGPHAVLGGAVSGVPAGSTVTSLTFDGTVGIKTTGIFQQGAVTGAIPYMDAEGKMTGLALGPGLSLSKGSLAAAAATTLTPSGDSPTITIDLALGNYFIVKLANVTGTPVIQFANAAAGSNCILEMDQPAKQINCIFPAGTIQAGGGGNTYHASGAGAVDLVTAVCNGSGYLISVTKGYF